MSRQILAVVLLVLAFVSAGTAQEQPKHPNLDKDRLALKGYDPVSYFTAAKPSKGDAKITSEHQGAVYRFASEENKAKFLAEPAKYAPEYGGWCAKALADKKLVDIDPLNFKITNGRLFLFYKGVFGDALSIWNKDEANLTQRADRNWKEIEAGK